MQANSLAAKGKERKESISAMLKAHMKTNLQAVKKKKKSPSAINAILKA